MEIDVQSSLCRLSRQCWSPKPWGDLEMDVALGDMGEVALAVLRERVGSMVLEGSSNLNNSVVL